MVCAFTKVSKWLENLFQVTNAFQFSIIKDGKDDMAVSNVEFHMTQQDSQPAMISKYACEGFSFTGECKVASLCTYKFAKCALTSAPVAAAVPATSEGPVLRPRTSTAKPSTTRPPFRNGT